MKFFKKLTDKRLVKEIKSQQGEIHFRRWKIIESKFFNIYIHQILKPDEDVHLHDHPWNFLSFILANGYWEQLEEQPYIHLPFSILYRKAEQAHSIRFFIDEQENKACWTFVITGKRKRDWGYILDDGSWINNKEYRILKHAGKL